MKDRLFIYGSGGHSRVVAATAESSGMDVAGLFDDNPDLHGTEIDGYPVLGSFDRAVAYEGCMVVAIGVNETRRRIAAFLRDHVTFAAVQHPSSIVHRSVAIGAGSVVFAGAVIQPGTSIGEHAIINTGASVDHDSIIGDGVHIAPGVRIAGNVIIGDDAFLGVGSAVIPGVTIGAGAAIGAGAVVIRDVPPGATVVGVPAR